MTISLDDQLRVRDFFYPNVGLENHLKSHEFRIGFWIDGKFDWINKNWNISTKYLPETLVCKSIAKNPEFNIQLIFNDAIHYSKDIFIRKIIIKNLGSKNRLSKIFFSHDLHIYGENSGDTVMFEPSSQSIIHFKRQRYFLINGETEHKHGIDQYATGIKESFGKEGTFKDAEDGVLEGNPIAQGSVDSVVSFNLQLKPYSESILYYWIACGRNFEEVLNENLFVKNIGIEQLLLETENYWSSWVNKKHLNFNILPSNLIRLYKRSLLTMRTHVNQNGAIIASCDSDVLQFNRDTYSYVWPRDGAFVAQAFDLAGFQEISRLFFRFCDKVINKDGYFNHKYSPDGSVGSSWHPFVDNKCQFQLPIQEDETALVLFALWKHFQIYRDFEFIKEVYPNLVGKTTDFLLNYIDPTTGLPKSSYDIWEEKRGVFTTTVATVVAALNAGAQFAKTFYDRKRFNILNRAAKKMKSAMLNFLVDHDRGCFIKAISPDGELDLSIDSSLSMIFILGVVDSSNPILQKTMDIIEKKLWIQNRIGGLARHENDNFQKVDEKYTGNPWIITTLWMARWKIAQAETVEDLKNYGFNLLNWVYENSLESCILPEQISPVDGNPISVSPLIWSHAEFILSIIEFLRKYQSFHHKDIEPF
ncbi:MAG: glycoside hydrolase family 15 protein [Candidatus Bathyarchaeota archaeon]